ncbi:OmpA family protein [Pseudorhodoferax soli]|uniref:Outer membrane protein OmpA-like peptidoglycan-associated protein n=1 Tax=Pseudorhodoferax soli TaxID=545864 RepID=A0A368Y763_9BURK|nr:OmpA family protein [Pseudorhodoferax soli]RCW74647.1 outer membrane protein OmpA-like peptidoglycan-associated protein [Pseudorhodoferax soli]
MELHRIAPRRAWLLGAAWGSAWLLAACAAPPPPPPPPPSPPAPSRQERLRALGFRPTDEGWELSIAGRMLFDSDSDMLDAEGQATAERLGQQLAQLEITRVRIEGHADSTGSEAYNIALSLRRAQAVQRAMAAAGLHDADIQALGLGKAAPMNDNRTPEQRQQNRRVAIVLPAH